MILFGAVVQGRQQQSSTAGSTIGFRRGLKKAHMTDIRKPFERACVDGDVPNFRIHDLRHSFCALPVLNGGTLYEAQQLLGHKDSATTLRYAHLSQDALKVATEKVAAQIDKVGGV